MTVKDIIKKSAELLNMKDVLLYLNNVENSPSQETLATVSSLTGLSNLVLNELAVTFVPMTTTETKIVTNGKLNFSSLTKTPYKIISVCDEYGESVFYTLTPTAIKVSLRTVVVTYAYIPSNYGLTDVVGYTESEISSRLISYALCAEYLITVSAFDEAVMWRKRFTEELEALFKASESAEVSAPKTKMMKGRRFI